MIWVKALNRASGVFVVLMLAAGCGGESGSGSGGGSSGTRTVEYAEGMSEVPREPDRVVAVGGFAVDTMQALDVEPTGAGSQDTQPAYLGDGLEGIESIGDATEPNLESIAALEPDLILSLEGYENYDEMSEIAPTVAPAFESSAEWKDIHLKYSEALGMKEEGQQVLDDYDARIQEFRDEMGDGLKETQVSILRVRTGAYNIYLPDSFPGTVVEDTGLPRPENQRGTGFTRDISRETISDIEADHAFVWTYGAGDELAEQEQEELADLRQDPLWRRLDVVERGDVTVGGDHWIGSGPLAAELVLEDVSGALAEENEN